MGFSATFQSVFFGMCEILVIVLAGYFFFRYKLLNNESVRGLTGLTINLFLPCLIFSHFIKNFSFDSPKEWWLYPLFGIGVSFLGAVMARVMLFFDRSITAKREFISLLAFQNCGYLPLVLVLAVFPKDVTQVLFTYIFLFIQGFNFIFWSFGVWFLTGEKGSSFGIKKAVNPPFAALILSLIFVWLNIRSYMPIPLIRAITMVGDCTLPAALLSLGAVLGGCTVRLNSEAAKFIWKTVLCKMVIFPLMFLVGLYYLRIPQLMALLLMIEAAMPSAINLSVVSFYNDPKCNIVSQTVLITHLFGLISIPFFMSMFAFFVK